jgi:biotin carboxyl carrier protein
MKEVNITVNGKSYQVKVGDVSSFPVEVEVNGKSYMVELETPDAPVMPVVSHSAPAPVARVAAVPVAKPQPVGDGQFVRAPMPGTIVLINSKAGDSVKRGDTMLSLEAMKMKNAIKSPFDGVIKEIHVTDGQKVAYNDVLVSFE